MSQAQLYALFVVKWMTHDLNPGSLAQGSAGPIPILGFH